MLTPPNRNFSILSTILIALGIAMAGVYGHELLTLPEYTSKQIEAKAQDQIMVELSRIGHLPNGEELRRMHAAARESTIADIAAQRKQLEQNVGMGLICLVFGMGHALLRYQLKRATAQKSGSGNA